jgi:hypothetical protein
MRDGPPELIVGLQPRHRRRESAIPAVRPRVSELITEEGWCEHCQREVCSTHPLQVSRAGGAAGVQLGPRALALACDLHKAKGLSMRKTVAVLGDMFELGKRSRPEHGLG